MLECGDDIEEADDMRGDPELGDGEPDSLDKLGLYCCCSGLLAVSLILTGDKRSLAAAALPMDALLTCRDERELAVTEGSKLSSCPFELGLDCIEVQPVLCLKKCQELSRERKDLLGS